MRICLIITGLGMGGAENQVVNLADAFCAQGHTVLLIVLTGEALVLPKDIRVRVVLLRSRKTPRSLLGAYLKARRIIKNFSPTVVHSNMIHANIFARILRLTTPIPRLVCTAHSTNEGGFLRTLAYNLTDRLADISTNVSNEAVACYIKKRAVGSGRMITMYNGIDTNKYLFSPYLRASVRNELSLSDGTRVVLAVGRLNEEKDFPNLLRAFETLLKDGYNCILLIAGAGPLGKKLSAFAYELGISERVHFLGIRNDVPALMSAADLFVLSSRYEGFGLVVAEAMACGRIVVATDCGGVAEVVGDAGYLVPSRDSDALAKGMETALSMPINLHDRMAVCARNRIVEMYSLTAISARWIELYKGIV
jgi:Glycosyltransferase